MMTYTRAPKAYGTNGAWMRQQALDACDDRCLEQLSAWPNAIGHGPLDAPECIPTGRVTVERGFLFFELARREP